MRRTVTLAVILLAAAPAAALTVLDVDFEGEPLDQIIGLGGAAAGQPVDYYNTVPTVRDGPMGSACLEMTDITDFGAGDVRFEFLDGIEVTTGSVEISCDVWAGVQDDYKIDVREQSGSTRSFLSIYLRDTGTAYFNDAAGSITAADWEAGRAIHLRVVFDMDAGTYNLWWDRRLTILGRAHGITDRGVGSVGFGPDHDVDLDGLFYVDDLRVETEVPTAAESAGWGEIKSLWR